MTRRRVVLTFPHHDAAFRAHVEAAQATAGGWDAVAVQEQIRQAYPLATIHHASSFARGDLQPETWYAYRDGTIKPTPADEWWFDPALPTTVMRPDGTYIDANDAAAELFGRPVSEITASVAGSFTRHERSPEVARRLFAKLAETGTLRSTAVVVRADGDERPIEFHTRREGEVYVTVMRPLP